MVAPWLVIIAPRIVCNSLFLPKKMCAKPYIFIRKFAENVKRWKQADSMMPIGVGGWCSLGSSAVV